MSLFHLELTSINLDNIQELMNNEVNESKTLEYKRELNFDKESKKEFLNDVSAMANGEGGDIVFGIEESKESPCKIIGMKIDNIDKFKLQIESLIRDSISPRLTFDTSFIDYQENLYIVIIRIPKSTFSPHMVTFSKEQGFYTRNSAGKHKMDIGEIRQSCLTSAGYSKDAYLTHLIDELVYNKQALSNIITYLVDNPPIENALEPLNIGTKHLRLEAWDALVRAGILPLIPFEQQKAFQNTDKSIREAARIIQMENAEWQRVLQFHKWAKETNPQTQGNPKDIYQQIERRIRDTINNTIHTISRTLELFHQKS